MLALLAPIALIAIAAAHLASSSRRAPRGPTRAAGPRRAEVRARGSTRTADQRRAEGRARGVARARERRRDALDRARRLEASRRRALLELGARLGLGPSLKRADVSSADDLRVRVLDGVRRRRMFTVRGLQRERSELEALSRLRGRIARARHELRRM